MEPKGSSKPIFLMDLDENFVSLNAVILIIWFTPPLKYAILIDNKYQRQDLIKLQFLTLNLEKNIQILMLKPGAISAICNFV